MAEFAVNSQRKDPYRNFKFLVIWDGKPVAGLQKCGGLKKTTEVVEWRESGDPSVVRKLFGRTTFQPIQFEAGLTHDAAFEAWANLVNNNSGHDADNKIASFRKDVLQIQVLNEEGKPVIGYNVKRAWVSEYQALPDLDSSAHAVAITSIKIENEGWERDPAIVEQPLTAGA